MPSTLPRVTHEHHERLMTKVDELPATGDALLSATTADLQRRLDQAEDLLTGLLSPHLEAAEANLYPELERLLQNRHSMAPMRREHIEIRRMIAEFTTLRRTIGIGRPTKGQAVALRRVIFQLYALLKVHLVEEELYVGIVDRGVSPEAAEMLAAAMDHPVGVRD